MCWEPTRPGLAGPGRAWDLVRPDARMTLLLEREPALVVGRFEVWGLAVVTAEDLPRGHKVLAVSPTCAS